MTTIQNIFIRVFSLIFTIFSLISYATTSADSGQNAEEFVKNISDTVLKVIQSKITEDKKAKKLEELFIASVDIDWMAKFAIAKSWKNMSDEQKTQYLAAYRQYIVKTYVPRFKEYNNQVVKVIGSKDMNNGQYQVMTQIISNQGEEKTTINISYRCKESDGKFKVRDIIGEDFSLLATQRSEFAAVIEKGGIEKLIKTLLNK
jgi:phospholipid transport system substrate-binding protein